jgi:phosphoenolpyruvate carboxykinase (GTP)
VDDAGKFVWPGFGDNMRVLKWVLDRVHGRVGARETPIGLLPHMADLNLDGMSLPRSKIERLFEIKPAEWRDEIRDIQSFFAPFGRHIPYEIRNLTEDLAKAMKA